MARRSGLRLIACAAEASMFQQEGDGFLNSRNPTQVTPGDFGLGFYWNFSTRLFQLTASSGD